jgi:hypothetical protein
MGARIIQGYFLGGQPRPIAAPPAMLQRRAAPAILSPSAQAGPPPPAFAAQAGAAQRFGGKGDFAVDPVQLGLARSGGSPLPGPLLAKMEAAFGADFSGVRVHVGPQAARIGAIAFTTGNDLYFAPGRYQPDSVQGQQLIGHELAHVVQQRQGRVRTQGSGVSVVQDHALEAEADRLGMRAAMHREMSAARIQPKLAPFPQHAPGRPTGNTIQPAVSAPRVVHNKWANRPRPARRAANARTHRAKWLRELDAHRASWGNTWNRAAVDLPEGLLRDIRDLGAEAMIRAVDKRRTQNLARLDQLLAAVSNPTVDPSNLSRQVQQFISDLGVKSPNVKNKLSEYVTAKTLWFNGGAAGLGNMRIIPGPPAVGGSDSPDYEVAGHNKIIGDNLKISGIRAMRDGQPTLLRAPTLAENGAAIESVFAACRKGVTSKIDTYHKRYTDLGQKVFVTLDLTENPWITSDENLQKLKQRFATVPRDKLRQLERVLVLVEGRIALSWMSPA